MREALVMRIDLASLARDIALAVLAVVGACDIDIGAAAPASCVLDIDASAQSARDIDVAPLAARDIDIAPLDAGDLDLAPLAARAGARVLLDKPGRAP